MFGRKAKVTCPHCSSKQRLDKIRIGNKISQSSNYDRYIDCGNCGKAIIVTDLVGEADSQAKSEQDWNDLRDSLLE